MDATAGPPTAKLKALLGDIKHNLWLEGHGDGKSEDQIKLEWAQVANELAPLLGTSSPIAQASHATSSPATAASTSFLSRPSADVGPVSMQRCRTDQPIMQQRQSAIHCPPMNPRKRSSSSTHAITQSTEIRSPTSPAFTSPIEVYDGSRKLARTASAPRPTARFANATVYENPADFFAKGSSFAGHHSRSNSSSQQSVPTIVPQQLASSPTIPSPLSSSYTSSAPPLTPDSAGMQSTPIFSPYIDMSRQGSLGGEFRTGFSSAMNIQSPSTDGSHRAAAFSQQPPRGYPVSHRTSVGGQSAMQPLIPEDTEQIIPDIAVSAPEPSPLASFAHRAARTDLSKMRHASTGSVTQQDFSKRPQGLPTERPLMPKAVDSDVQKSRLASQQMMRVSSDVGYPPEKYQIAKAPYSRPQKEKLKCQQCNKCPNGFRGDHELRRHNKLHHSPNRTAWVCVDASGNNSMLGGCKHCRDGKKYGAYYNAAAHLRRVHFCPKSSARKARGHPSDRAGKGGGDWPPMEELKSKWMEEVEVSGEEHVEVEEDADQEDDAMEDEAYAPPFVNDRSDALPMALPLSYTVADAGVFSFALRSEPDPTFDGLDPMQGFDEELFPFEAPPAALPQRQF